MRFLKRLCIFEPMKIIKIPFWILWRVWFYILVLLPIIVMFPFLFLSFLKESWYPHFFKMARIWAKVILYGMGFYPKVEEDQEIIPNKSYMFIGNHTSMLDIMLMLVTVKNPFVFVGKKELVKIPLFGYFYKRAVIMVDRDSPKSRQQVYERAQRRINQKLSICIFPEGKVPDDESIVLDTFKTGAFNLAVDHDLPIVPMLFPDNKKHFSYTFFSGYPGKLRVKILKFIETETKDHHDRKIIRDDAQKLMYDELVRLEKEDN